MFCMIFDTETTGLVINHLTKEQPEVIEFYAASMDLSTGAKKRELHYLIKPAKPLAYIKDKKALVHGHTDETLKDCPSFSEIANELRDFIEDHKVAIAHNASFDKEMIDLEFEKIKRPIPNWERVICTVEQTTHLEGRRLSLTDLHMLLFNEKFQDAHKADIDAQALIRCCVELYKRGML